MELIPDSIQTMQKALDIRAANQRVIASNLANIDTPGYVAQRVNFEASMRNALDEIEQPVIVESSTAAPSSLDGNNVALETELGEMSRNKTMYNLIAQMLANKFRQISTIVDSS